MQAFPRRGRRVEYPDDHGRMISTITGMGTTLIDPLADVLELGREARHQLAVGAADHDSANHAEHAQVVMNGARLTPSSPQ